MVKRFGEKATLYIGQFFGAIGMFGAGIARNSVEFFASIPIISLWNISMPAAQSMMTHRVSEQEQGELQAPCKACARSHSSLVLGCFCAYSAGL